MIFQKDLPDIINFATKECSLFVRIVTNGFWADSYNHSLDILKELTNAGLKEINFSTGDEHQIFVPIQNIKNGIFASVRVGLKPVVNIESNDGQRFTSKYFFQDKNLFALLNDEKIELLNGIWIPFKSSNIKELQSDDIVITYNHKPCDNIFKTVCIDANHRMLACCGLAVKYVKYLDLGNLCKVSMKELYNNQFQDFIKIWLFVDGPYKILEFLSKYIRVDLEEFKKLHDCQICAMILNNESCICILKQNYKKVFANIMFKYLTKIKSNENK